MLPLFPVTSVGSWPRSPALQRALARKHRGQLSGEEFDRVADAAVLEALRAQEAAGCDIVTDGEQRRDNFYSFVAEKLDGVKLLSLAEMLDVVEDKEGFRRILDTLDVPAFSIHNPTCVGRIRRRRAAGRRRIRLPPAAHRPADQGGAAGALHPHARHVGEGGHAERLPGQGGPRRRRGRDPPRGSLRLAGGRRATSSSSTSPCSPNSCSRRGRRGRSCVRRSPPARTPPRSWSSRWT